MVTAHSRTRQPADAVQVDNDAPARDAPATGQSSSRSDQSEPSSQNGAADFERKVQTPAEREAKKALRKVEAEKAMLDHAKAQKAFTENRERLKSERLVRETVLK